MLINSKSVISEYVDYVKSFDGIEDFDFENRSKYTLSLYGKLVQRIKIYGTLFLMSISNLSYCNKYIFHGYRFPEIIDLFDKSDCTVIGGLSDMFRTISTRRSFIWGGGVISAFEIALHTENYEYLDKMIDVISKLNHNKTDNSFLYLYEDTQPLGRVLSSVFKENPKIHTICIAHSLLSVNKAGLIVDGNNSNVNLVWDETQRVFFDEKKTKVAVFGIPYEVNIVEEVDLNRIILLGYAGPTTNLFEYMLTYSHMIYIYDLLKRYDYDVKFKPHPQDKSSFPSEIFGEDVVFDFHEEIKRGAVFAGFASSAMYEAKKHGLFVIGLDTDLLSYERSFEYDREFTIAEYKSIPGYLKTLQAKNSDNLEYKKLPVRFEQAVSSIDLWS